MNEIALTFAGFIAMIAIGVWAWFYLKPIDHAQECAKLLREARSAALQHAAAAEHHRALAGMYKLRVKRLGGTMVPVSGEPGDTQFGAL